MLSRDPHPPRRPGARSMRARRTRASAALAALVFALASLLGVVHEATTTHVRCAAHGELVDSEAVAGAAAGPVCATLAGAGRAARGHGDDHCLLASATRQSRIAARPPAVLTAIVTVDRIVIAAPRHVPVPRATLYRIAPKTSPPA